jgi:hypothetical protein
MGDACGNASDDQDVPFQTADMLPTAMQNVEERHETPRRSPVTFGPEFGDAWR